ncbi:MAG TPA: hypothetical protein VLB74_06145 [Flavobacterium sp.]|uniref:hypothetical protein n=1 Tax=Flavobacterium sp. TaxID=239 RepID=UPI002B6F9DE2|nr:hypothetical protein [Flavobacterium sp.]HSD14209.1 hypothetical protein [Flavobacterium sp.]
MKNFIAIGNWKSFGFLCLALFAGLFIFSCSDDDDDIPPGTTASSITPYNCTSCSDVPQGLPENDNLAKGIYKGIFPSGTLAINYKNEVPNASDIGSANGVVYYKNKVITLTEYPEIIISAGRPVYTLFEGSMGDTRVQLYFSVNEDGSNPQVSDFSISDPTMPSERSISCVIFKERSNALLEAFEGNYFRSNTVVPGNPNPSVPDDTSSIPDGTTARVDPGLVHPDANATNVGSVKLVLSRAEGMWLLYKVMDGANGSVLDKGSIDDGTLISDITGKRVSYLRGDELNYSENVSSGTFFLHAERKR